MGRETIPYGTRIAPNIFVLQLETCTIHAKPALKPKGLPRRCLLGHVRKEIMNYHQATSALSQPFPRRQRLS